MVSQAAKQLNEYAEIFQAVAESPGPETSWIRRLRDTAFDRFQQVGFPTTSDEEWKYTNVTPIVNGDFSPMVDDISPPSLTDEDIEGHLFAEARATSIVFINGIFTPERSKLGALPDGVVVMDLLQATRTEEHGEAIRAELARQADYNEDGFTALNTALFGSGAFIRIPRGQQIDTPIHVLFLFEPRFAAITTFPRLLIISEEDSAATVIESYAHSQDGPGFTNAVTEIVLQQAARLRHYRLQRESQEVFHVATTKVDLGPQSSYDTTAVTLGAKLSRHTIGVTMDHEGAECWVDGLYMVDGTQHTDTHSLIDHRKPHCTSHQLYKGILNGKSRAVFNGKVFVRPGAQQTDAMQTNKNMLLSNDARVDTKPQLEIFADDVKCAHGAAIGQLDEDEIFYLESRGLRPELARNLLTYGFAEEVIEKIKIESIKRDLDAAVLNRLHAQLET